MFSHERTQEKDDEIQIHHIHENTTHDYVQLSLSEFVFENELKMKTKTKLMKLFSQHSFLQQLLNVYRREYDIHVMNFDSKILK